MNNKTTTFGVHPRRMEGAAHQLKDVALNETSGADAYCHTCEVYGHSTCWPEDVYRDGDSE